MATRSMDEIKMTINNPSCCRFLASFIFFIQLTIPSFHKQVNSKIYVYVTASKVLIQFDRNGLIILFCSLPINIHFRQRHFSYLFSFFCGLRFQKLKSFDKFFIGSFKCFFWVYIHKTGIVDQ